MSKVYLKKSRSSAKESEGAIIHELLHEDTGAIDADPTIVVLPLQTGHEESNANIPLEEANIQGVEVPQNILVAANQVQIPVVDSSAVKSRRKRLARPVGKISFETKNGNFFF